MSDENDRPPRDPTAKPAKKRFHRQHELDAAEDFIRDTKFAAIGEGKTVRPFSRQLKTRIKELFPDDAAIYAQTEKMQRTVALRFLMMRTITLALLIAFAFAFYGMALSICGSGFALLPGAIAAKISPSLLMPAQVAVVGVALVLLRAAVRAGVIFELKHLVESLSHIVSKEHTDIITECGDVIHEITNIAEDNWSEHAESSAKVALWYALRADYLDRFSTTVLWKIDTFFRHAELSFWVVKFGILVAAPLALWQSGTFTASCRATHATEIWLSIAAFELIAVLGWIVDRRPNDIITKIFEEAAKSDSARKHYFNAFAVEIKKLVALAERAIPRRTI